MEISTLCTNITPVPIDGPFAPSKLRNCLAHDSLSLDKIKAIGRGGMPKSCIVPPHADNGPAIFAVHIALFLILAPFISRRLWASKRWPYMYLEALIESARRATTIADNGRPAVEIRWGFGQTFRRDPCVTSDFRQHQSQRSSMVLVKSVAI
ncbi:hypothetical protein ARMSODRAFT_1018303 [Armillaria solidipes]|uniref:Uncharacterized protein n=1 Tax=Armillaria solidipes TaxID=1076256 RepID=A0A2H3BVX7_9AGAR|nr:hypothetical protein ARMSODRAFT_1018303 [Armillaria solidipes]